MVPQRGLFCGQGNGPSEEPFWRLFFLSVTIELKHFGNCFFHLESDILIGSHTNHYTQ